jgi:sirohydrochlorin ferrochelatase
METHPPDMMRRDTALLLIAHGSQNAEANAELRSLAIELRHTGAYRVVEPAFLELAEPGIDVGAKRCVDSGARRVILLPYFLSAGIHVRRDLTAARERLAERYGEIEFRLAAPLGPHPLLAEIVRQRAQQAAEELRNI